MASSIGFGIHPKGLKVELSLMVPVRTIIMSGNPPHQSPEAFIKYWSDKGGSERANYQKFINQLCALIGTAEPDASSEQDALNNYVYEKRVRALDLEGDDGRNNYLDCYKRDCFVLEAKQSRKRQRGGQEGSDLFGGLPHSSPPAGTRPSWDRLMRQARAQAERYAKALPTDHGWPPFLIVVDVGRRFGFITTNSITQTFSRRVIQRHLDAKTPLYLTFAIPDHPWADGQGAAAVRVAMTVGAPVEHDERTGLLKTVEHEGQAPDRDGAVPVVLAVRHGRIHANLTTGADVAAAKALKANDGLSSPGVKLHGSGFLVTPAQARALGLGRIAGLEERIREYRNGRDLTARSRGLMVIDLFGMTETEVRQKYPDVYQWLLDRVKPERDNNNRKSYRENWWIFGEPRMELRNAINGIDRYIATVETSRHRVFQSLPSNMVPDNKFILIFSNEAYILGMLSSRSHCTWSISTGGWLGQGNDPVYVKTRCFDTFPFPNATRHQKRVIGQLAEELDAHRKRVLAEHPDRLTLTELYNVLEKGRSREELTAREMEIYQLGQVGVMLDLHGRIDHAVADAYGWPADLEDARILENLVALNAERHREERDGLVRWLRPDYQNPKGQGAAVQIAATLDIAADTAKRIVWPKAPTEQVHSLMAALSRCGRAVEAESLARQFKGAKSPRVRELLDILVSVGHARQINNLYAP